VHLGRRCKRGRVALPAGDRDQHAAREAGRRPICSNASCAAERDAHLRWLAPG
jgi:hypothetical protein